MKKKSIVLRELANRDIEEACSHYLDEGAAVVALDFIDTLEAAFAGIARHPGAGSSRYARELNLPGLRSRVVTNYPFMIFYRELDDRIDVWRVLHGHRDIPAAMSGPSGETHPHEQPDHGEAEGEG